EQQYDIPLEQIYTGKMLLGLSDLIQQGTFPIDHRILVIHSGGLQGRLATL
ncbi:MAG TPA: 1-aminocyclopropane-1-carboxylate deaminase/D-cysteine desulfhydrase, partial [Acinetobacter johnsonii]|nr:1-aminocyclopropane-1-carboxylate deaminase/D-cysteine desulfhydrase [Acinetobacter johnsonii]